MFFFSLGLAFLYFCLQAFYAEHWRRLPSVVPDQYGRRNVRVSVIVPARNEEKHILACLDALMNQTYPGELLEILVVDDHSEDNTHELAASRSPGVDVISMGMEGMKGGKKNALRQGIAKSSGDWIITVDADCTLHPEAVEASVYAHQHSGFKLLTGPVLIEEPETPLDYFQSYELAGLMLITGSGYQSGLHALANGAFLSFEKEAYEAVQDGGLHDPFASGDDMFLAEALETMYPGQTGFLKSQRIRAVTKAEPGWNSFLRQRLRWASKNRHLKNRKINLVWGFQWVYGLAICISLGGTFIHPAAWFPVLIVLLTGKWTGDLLLLLTALSFFRLRFSVVQFLAAEIFQVAYILSVGSWVLSGGRKYRWKGRRVQ